MSKKLVMTQFQHKCINVLYAADEPLSLLRIANQVNSSQIAVFSAMESLRKKGKADYIRSFPKDQWSVQLWFLI